MPCTGPHAYFTTCELVKVYLVHLLTEMYVMYIMHIYFTNLSYYYILIIYLPCCVHAIQTLLLYSTLYKHYFSYLDIS